ncbi:restriction endonuclease subunit S [Brumimicrobium salinarum]|uniref:Restriction endonuclease subunit S n=1 Tax=Brumimicrobium salinarum TaxID=2058658 RepID=A0A2I0R5B5_9FLAO|nr:restriction endonuclease subunit S [Brumimicrobium salinarum]PKR81774.1 restriction endonuclease subunit S [Brumimicrobium salinarum]
MKKLKNQKPSIRFKEFSYNWPQVRMGDILKIGSGKDYKHLNPGDIPVFGSGGYMTSVDEAIYSGETVFIGRKGSIDKPFYYNGAFWTVDTLFYTRDFKKCVPKFVYCLFQNINWYKYNAASGVPSLSKKTIESIIIDIPSLPEQQKIASFLTKVDEKIANLSKKKELLEEYKKGVTQKIFKQEIRFKIRNEAGVLVEPPKWQKRKLGSLTYKVGKKNKEKISYPIYSINNQEGFLPQSEQFEGLNSNDRGYDISMYKIVNEKTFAYNPARINVGSIGYSHDLNKVIISSLYVCFKTNEDLEDLFLLVYLNTKRFNTDIIRYEEGGVRQYLFYDNFSQIEIPLPCKNEQNKIADFLSTIDKKISAVDQQLSLAKEWKKGLLQKMFV